MNLGGSDGADQRILFDARNKRPDRRRHDLGGTTSLGVIQPVEVDRESDHVPERVDDDNLGFPNQRRYGCDSNLADLSLSDVGPDEVDLGGVGVVGFHVDTVQRLPQTSQAFS